MIPIYIAKIKDNTEGIYAISLVDNPAIETGFLKFNKDKICLSVIDEDKQIILGPIMRANFPIYRYSKDIGEYYIKYTPETIVEMSKKLLSDNTFNNISLMHNGINISGVKLMQLFIKDKSKGISPVGFESIEDGSLFAEYKIEDDNLWQEIKNGKFYGFSLEGYFSISKEMMEHNKIESKNIIKNKMIKNTLKFMQSLIKLGNIETDKGTIYWVGDQDLKEGDEVYLDGEEGATPVEDGEYVTADGKVIIVKEGKVESINDPEAEIAAEVVDPNDKSKNEGDKSTELETKLNDLTAKVDELAEKIKQLEQAAADEPIEDAYSRISAVRSGGKIELVY